ncbi:hypothetical protein [Sulfitobacter sp. 1A13679]|uniref:hypothetical protein n=1 Tax=Sulfitobacter sp. 1A13679 TaxID=3368597 RepID=UPI0037467883
MKKQRLTTVAEALELLAKSPGNPKYLELYDSVSDVAKARSKREISLSEYHEKIEEIVSKMKTVADTAAVELAVSCDKLSADDEAFLRAQVKQRLTEIKLGIAQ